MDKLLRFVALLLVACTCLSFAREGRRDDPPRILVTNDDGIGAPGLKALVRALAEVGDVYVSAPSENRSGASHSLSYFSTSFLVEEHELEGAVRAVSVNGTPADAAHFGIMELGAGEGFDLLVSGINHGSNVGELSHGSGTVGAAMEGAFRRIPSMAVSMDARMRDIDAAATFASRFAEAWLERGTDASVVYSINIPRRNADGWKGIRPAPMGGSYLRAQTYNEGEEAEGGRYYRARLEFERDFPEGTDSAAYMEGFVTITPLRFDWTHREALADLEEWGL